jgi:tricorn protease
MTEFAKHFYANLDKDGLVIDVRYNGGGIVSGQILERLRRVIFEYDQGRYGEPEPYHRTAYLGRLVVLCNEHTGSDGEYFCTGFRYMKLGPTVGTRTWGGFMAVSGIGAIDGGFISTPVMGSFTPEGKWLPDGYGFNPDVVVDEDPNAFVAGRDPQMDKAIELLQEQIRRDPPHWPKRMDPPSKEKAFSPNRK